MGQDTNLINFIIALVGVIGTGVGITASLIPMELIGQRDSYQRTVNTWRLLISEMHRIKKLCDVISAELKHAIEIATENGIEPRFINYIALEGLQPILMNGEFISQLPSDVRITLLDLYDAVTLMNVMTSQYSNYIANVLIVYEGKDYSTSIVEFYNIIHERCLMVGKYFQQLEPEIIDQEKMALEKVLGLQRWISFLKWFGAIIFTGVIAACVFLAFIYIRH